MEAVRLSPIRRDLYLRIVENKRDNVHPITMRLFFIEDHFPTDKIESALRWLIKNNYTGNSFVSWFSSECQNSDLIMHKKLLEVVNNENITRVIAGKNFKA